MDVKRIVLFSSLAVVAYLLILQWNQDYQQHPGQTATAAQQTKKLAQTVNKITPEDSILEFASPQANSTIEPNKSTSAKDLISVTTDNYEILINPRGGDLVYAALLQHKTRVDIPTPFVLLEDNSERSYIIQSDLVGLGNQQRLQLNSDQSSYTLEEGQQELKVNLTTVINGINLTKTFTFTRDSYVINVDYYLENTTNELLSTSFVGLIKRDSSPDPSRAEFMGMKAFLGGAFSTQDKRYHKISFDDFKNKGYESDSVGGWAALLQHYFISAWIPNQTEKSFFSTRVDRQGNYLVGFNGSEYLVEPQTTLNLGAQIYLGPKVQSSMKAVAPNLELSVDYGWLWFIAQPLFLLLDFIHKYVGNWGLAIILLTVIIKAAFYKLSATSYRSMANMRRLAPKLARIKDEVGDDRQKMSQQMMELYRKEKINPMGGCLPILVQMPVFIALYWMLMESVELRHAPFMLWIVDLSMKDPYFVLPILMGLSMFVQQLLNPEPPDPLQAKIMKILPVVFTFFFLFFPAGLVLYWVVNNIISILQQWYITKKIEQEHAS